MRRMQRQKRIVVMILFTMAAGIGLTGRLAYIQLIKGPEFARAAVIQRSLRFVYATGRGQILDRNGYSLLDTQQKPVLVSFGPILDQETRLVLAENDAMVPVQVMRDPDPALLRYFADRDAPGIIRLSEEHRYGSRLLAPHVTGFIQKKETVKNRPSYRELSYVAKDGLELAFDEYLTAGRPATLAAMVDAQGALIEGLGYRDWRDTDPQRPYNIITTLDRSAQTVVERVGGRYLESGAVVVVEPRSGDILAMASFPGYSPGDMFRGASIEEYNKLVANPYTPFINKAIHSYPPGSVFKVVLAAAALEKGLVEQDEPFVCTGSIEVGDRVVSCYQGRAHGELDLQKALAMSCNSYFIQLAQRLGRNTVLEYARLFGLGRPSGIPLGGESAGRMPTAEQLPYLGDLANTSIGQGLVETTPLQLARLMSIIVNDGLDVRPRLLSEITDNSGATVRRFPVQYGARVISLMTARALKPMLEEVVKTGTANDAYSLIYTTAGKSGTAQSGRADIPSYTWFAGFTNMENDPLVIVVFAEARRELSAAGIFRQIAESLPGIVSR